MKMRLFSFLFALFLVGCAPIPIPVVTRDHPACTEMTPPTIPLSPLLEIDTPSTQRGGGC